jgi:xanthine dehydrogenase accessory factor
MIGYNVVVIDDRQEYAMEERFPEADQVIAADMASALSTFPTGPSTFIVLVTRGHGFDHSALRAVIDSRAAYIGMIGGRARVSAAFSRLIEDGVPREKLDQIYAPIGLRIGAQTPEEIALSIMAEIVNVRRGGDAPSSRDRRKEIEDV